jgi:hypothetical protein
MVSGVSRSFKRIPPRWALLGGVAVDGARQRTLCAAHIRRLDAVAGGVAGHGQ